MSGPTQAELDLALDAAARICGVARDQVYTAAPGARRARILAGCSLKALKRYAATTTAQMLKLAGPELSPSMLARKQITTDMMLDVAEALHTGDATHVTPVVEAAPVETAATPKAAVAKPSTPRRPKAETVAAVIVESGPTPAKRPQAVQRLKPVNAAKRRYARWFLAAGWSLDETAALFDVHEDALTDALSEADQASVDEARDAGAAA